MLHHRAFGRDLDSLVVAVIDNRRPILSLMRAMLAAIGTGRIETYESPTEAVAAMAKSVPDVVIAAAAMQPLTGAQLVRAMRRSIAGPLALVPAMIMSVRAKPALSSRKPSGQGPIKCWCCRPPRARSIGGSPG